MSVPLTPIGYLQKNGDIDTAINQYTRARTRNPNVTFTHTDDDVRIFANELINDLSSSPQSPELKAGDIAKLVTLAKRVSKIHQVTAQKIYDVSVRALLGKADSRAPALVERLEFRQRKLTMWEAICNSVLYYVRPQIYLQRVVAQTAPDLKLTPSQINTFIDKQCLALEYLSLLRSKNIPLDAKTIESCIEFADKDQGESILNKLRSLSSPNLKKCFDLIKNEQPGNKEAIITTFLLLPDYATDDKLKMILQETITATGRGLSTFEKIKSLASAKIGQLIRLVGQVEEERDSTIKAKESNQQESVTQRTSAAEKRIEELQEEASRKKINVQTASVIRLSDVKNNAEKQHIKVKVDTDSELGKIDREGKRRLKKAETQLEQLMGKQIDKEEKKIESDAQLKINTINVVHEADVAFPEEGIEDELETEALKGFGLEDFDETSASIDEEIARIKKIRTEEIKNEKEIKKDKEIQSILKEEENQLNALSQQISQLISDKTEEIVQIETAATLAVKTLMTSFENKSKQIEKELRNNVQEIKARLQEDLSKIDSELKKSLLKNEDDLKRVNKESDEKLQKSSKQTTEEYKHRKEWVPVAFLLLSDNISESSENNNAIIKFADDLYKADPNTRDSIERAAAKISNDVKQIQERAKQPTKDTTQDEEAAKELEIQKEHVKSLEKIRSDPSLAKEICEHAATEYQKTVQALIPLELASQNSTGDRNKYNIAAKRRYSEFFRLGELQEASRGEAEAEKVYEQAQKDLRFQQKLSINLTKDNESTFKNRVPLPSIENQIAQIKSLSKLLDTVTDAEEKNCIIEAVKLLPTQYQEQQKVSGNRALTNIHQLAALIQKIDPNKRQAFLAHLSNISTHLDDDKNGLMIVKLSEIQNKASEEMFVKLVESMSASSWGINDEKIEIIYHLEQKIKESGVSLSLGRIIKDCSLTELRWINDQVNKQRLPVLRDIFSEVASKTDAIKFKVLLAFPDSKGDSSFIQKVTDILMDLVYEDRQPILEAIAALPAELQLDLINKKINLFGNIDNLRKVVILKIMLLLYQNSAGFDERTIKSMLKNLSLEDLKTVENNLRTLHAAERMVVINEMAKIDNPSERLSYLEKGSTRVVTELSNKFENKVDRENIIDALSLMPDTDETTIKNLASLLQACNDELRNIIKALIINKVKKQNYSSFVTLALDLLPDLLQQNTKGQDTIRVLPLLANQKAETVRGVVALLQNCEEDGKQAVIEAISDPVIATQIPNFIARTTNVKSIIKKSIPDASENDSTIAAITVFQRLSPKEIGLVFSSIEKIDPPKRINALKAVIEDLAPKLDSQKGVQDILSAIGAIRLGGVTENISSISNSLNNELQEKTSTNVRVQSNQMNSIDQAYADSVDAVIGIIELLTPKERFSQSSKGMETFIENIATRFIKDPRKRASVLEVIKYFSKDTLTLEEVDELVNNLDTFETGQRKPVIEAFQFVSSSLTLDEIEDLMNKLDTTPSQRKPVGEALQFISAENLNSFTIKNITVVFAELGNSADVFLKEMKQLTRQKAAEFINKAASFFNSSLFDASQVKDFEEIYEVFQNSGKKVPPEIFTFSPSEMRDLLFGVRSIRDENSIKEASDRLSFVEQKVKELSTTTSSLKLEILQSILEIEKNKGIPSDDLFLIIHGLSLQEAVTFLRTAKECNIDSNTIGFINAKGRTKLEEKKSAIRAAELILQGVHLLSNSDKIAGFEIFKNLYDPKDLHNNKLISTVKLFESASPVNRTLNNLKGLIENIGDVFSLSPVSSFPLLQDEIAQTLSELDAADRLVFTNEAYEYLASSRLSKMPKDKNDHLAMLRAIRLYPPIDSAEQTQGQELRRTKWKFNNPDVRSLSEIMRTLGDDTYHTKGVIKVVELVPKEHHSIDLIKNVSAILKDLDPIETEKLADTLAELAKTKDINSIIAMLVKNYRLFRGIADRFSKINDFLEENKTRFKDLTPPDSPKSNTSYTGTDTGSSHESEID